MTLDDLLECKKCGHHHSIDKICRTCYYLNSPENIWIKIPTYFDMPSLQNFFVYVPKIQNFIFDVMYCDTCRYSCDLLHIATKNIAYGNETLKLVDCTHWRKLPPDPNGNELFYDHCGQNSSEHY